MIVRFFSSQVIKLWLLAAGLLLVVPSPGSADNNATFALVEVVEVRTPIAAPVPAEHVEQAKPAKGTKVRETSRLIRRHQPVVYPSLYPNPLAFNMTWITIPDTAFAQARASAARQQAVARRAALMQRVRPNAAAQNAIQQQLRRFLEPMLKVEISFAARAANLNHDERAKLTTDGKAWFETFLVDFVKNQDPEQQQMLVQGMQGVWFGNQQRKVENPRDKIRVGIAKLVNDTLPKEKAVAYAEECRKREEFARLASVANLVERLDEKVKLSPDQWRKIARSLNDHWDKSRDPQLESFALNRSMWPGAPDQWVLPELSPAQRLVLSRVNATSGQMFINGGVFGMFGGNVAEFDDSNDETNAEPAKPADQAEVLQPEAE